MNTTRSTNHGIYTKKFIKLMHLNSHRAPSDTLYPFDLINFASIPANVTLVAQWSNDEQDGDYLSSIKFINVLGQQTHELYIDRNELTIEATNALCHSSLFKLGHRSLFKMNTIQSFIDAIQTLTFAYGGIWNSATKLSNDQYEVDKSSEENMIKPYHVLSFLKTEPTMTVLDNYKRIWGLLTFDHIKHEAHLQYIRPLIQEKPTYADFPNEIDDLVSIARRITNRCAYTLMSY